MTVWTPNTCCGGCCRLPSREQPHFCARNTIDRLPRCDCPKMLGSANKASRDLCHERLCTHPEPRHYPSCAT
ncbi:hypothetical protein HBI56_132960 [Parastagonospora nodorum]|uniref:Uncharacterized protein n=1 Tax=Phaeosphaeria nodorum (strain SN15 / ATCC MYA-4574 / FGSC 10173) TaxID=321614 RepID=A0A7U2FBS3_PHANO|nr:hypothetical protein HBH56_036070 [Parastagonospora nodorum]QRD00056.1 hypothetical protein JI435_414490 [Parastagonospora nodorum SN15]KAH3933996.1 hypothetical protein HBH54_063400 [Parastagonospora nodorum]KAH3952630.1 hypothetical protein HBH53_046710 [Parastagonospora nodorum]KAH3979794.1 hypothetical protein HBH51_057730 [Parastagonospora nodorum]